MIYKLRSKFISYIRRQPFARRVFYILGSYKLAAYLRDKLTYDIVAVGRGNNYEWIFEAIDVSQSSGKAIIEVGSRDALDAIYLLSNTSCNHAFIFEPSVRNIPKCIANVLRSPLRDKITFLPIAAIGNAKNMPNAALSLIPFCEASTQGMSSIYPLEKPQKLYPSSFKNNTPGKIIESYNVPAIQLDFLEKYVHQDIFLVAIDVEGAESEVIEGGANLLKKTDYVCLEFSNSIKRVGLEGENISCFIRKMSALGFELLSVSKVDGLPGNDTSFQSDLLFYNVAKCLRKASED